MKSFLVKNKKIFAICSVVLVCAIVALAFSGGEAKVKNNVFSSATRAIPYVQSDSSLQLGSDINKLNVDSKSGALSFTGKHGDVTFDAMGEEASRNSLATVLSVRLRDSKGNIYSMDSSANSIAFSTFKVLKEKNKISIEYTLFPDADRAKTGVDKADIFACVTVDFTYANNKFKVSVDTEKIQLPKKFFVEELTILPGVSTVSAGNEGAFLTIPSGSGAVVDLYKVTQKPVAGSLSVYGNDTSFHTQEEGAILPFLAVTKQGVLLNTIIEDGDALSEIAYKKSAAGGGYAYNTFTVTPCKIEDGKFVHGESYEGLLSQVYILSSSSADYNDISAQVADSLVRRGYLSSTLNSTFNDFPFFIDVIGTPDGKKEYTTFEEAAEITAFLKSKGVRNIALRVSGANKNGLEGVSDEVDTFSGKLGGKSGFSKLCGTVAEQGNSIWLDANIFTDKYSKKSNPVKVYDRASKYAGIATKEFSLSGTEEVNDKISRVYKMVVDFEGANICLNDATQLLCTDVENKLTRQQVLYNLKDKVCSLSASGNLMLSDPAVYLMGEASSVFSAPDKSNLEDGDVIKSVPLLQMVLHGRIVYGSSIMNFTNYSPEDAVLKCIEYGAVPSFLFTHSANNNLDYSSYAAQTAKYYSKAKSLLPLMDMTMTSHEQIVSGVYKITYDYSKVVYVNYNPSVVEVDGVMVSAKDVVVI